MKKSESPPDLKKRERKAELISHIGSVEQEAADALRTRETADAYRKQNPVFAHWAQGCGVYQHSDQMQVRIHDMAELLVANGSVQDSNEVYWILAAADRIASAAAWLVVHLTYTRNVYVDNRDLMPEDFKPYPEGHTGGSLNMVPAYAGYLAINAISGFTRSWLMGQGHCVAAIDSLNLIVDNMNPAHAERYDLSQAGLSQFVRDFYSYAIRPDGKPESPLGSHVNPNTAGGMMEGGYLGFAELEYVHMPLPGERLVTFLSDGAFEEQRGSDWVPRWWRPLDSGIVTPILIANGRRIDQRTTLSQQGGVDWIRRHLELNGFRPFAIDGRDPAAFAWAIFEMEEQLKCAGQAAAAGQMAYPVAIPYAIASAPKGYGFPGAGTNEAHSLPLGAHPGKDEKIREKFNVAIHDLFVPFPELQDAINLMSNHEKNFRPKERDHPLARRRVKSPRLPVPDWRDPQKDNPVSAMRGIDSYFSLIVKNNPQLRPIVGNPDELQSNRMNYTLHYLKHRVPSPEAGSFEAIDGKIITALNEEAVVGAAIGNKGGINLVVTYEAFAMKMLGAIRQEITFVRHQRESGMMPGWLGLPLVLTSHTWENAKNEQSHQDPTMGEVLMGEMGDISRVLFPADWNTAVAALRSAYSAYGEIWTLVVPKGSQPVTFSLEQTNSLLREGGVRLRGNGGADEKLILAAIGAYQLTEVLHASKRLSEKGLAHSVVYLIEPGRFREPRDEREAAYVLPEKRREALFPPEVKARVFLSHTRPSPMFGVLRPLDTGFSSTRILGYVNHGGTLNTAGLLFANKCTWAHVIQASCEVLSLSPRDFLSEDEWEAVSGRRQPKDILF